MNIKLIISLIASVLLIIGYVPYFKDIFYKKTKPHLFTWLIWGITQGTATVLLLYGGGGFGSIGLIIGTMVVFCTFLLSFKYGTKDITNIDKLFLVSALLAIIIWWQLSNALIAVFIVSVIDGMGYIPTIRKTFKDPWSETLSFWLMMAIVDLLIIISNAEYNLLTVFYLSVLFIANITVFLICIFKRKVLPKTY
jgi:uncharacterized membrane protein YjjP (DUF1212 family)